MPPPRDSAAKLRITPARCRAAGASSEYIDADVGCIGLAAADVLARVRGRPAYTNAYTAKVDRWASSRIFTVDASLLQRAIATIDHILGDKSELKELWAGDEQWASAAADLRARLT